MKILITGGNGFLGSRIFNELLAEHEVFVLSRSQSKLEHYLQGDISDLESLRKLPLTGFDVIINCVGISPITYHSAEVYEQAHVRGVHNLLQIMEEAQVPKLVHISAIGADQQSALSYMQTKNQAENLIKNSQVTHLIIRPSLVVGEGSELEQILLKFSLFYFTILPSFGALFDPIYVGDLAKFVAHKITALQQSEIVELAGPRQRHLGDILAANARRLGLRVMRLPLPRFVINLALKIAARLHLTNPHLEQYIWKNNCARINVHQGQSDYLSAS